MKLSRHFRREEFACSCGCKSIAVDKVLIDVLEGVRTHFERGVKINSGYRCTTYNEKIGGGENSQHLLGKAADIVVKGVSPDKVHTFLNEKYPKLFGLGKYTTFTHIDVRDKRARW